VTWDFQDFPGAFPVLVQEVIPNKKIILQWEADTKNATWTTVTMEFSPLDDGRTLVRISEFGWPETTAGLTSCFGNCEGWTGMLCAMKAWLEHRINLRDGFYK
jgi:uncharacterized protein YndB with AHSA1/START domain